MIKCNYCDKELNDTNYFCDIECENNFRNKNQELYILNKDGHYEWICPIKNFVETDEELICENDSYKYNFYKSDIERWKLDVCSCLQEFTDIVVKF